MQDIKTRQCPKCRQSKNITNFQYTPSKFFPSHRSWICTQCLETSLDQTNLNEVDALMRHLDLPFNLDKWTQLYETHKDKTLSAYFNLLADEHYDHISWSDENERWRLAREEGTIDDEIAALSSAKMRRLKKVWGPTYSNEELLFLEDYYDQIVATQNVSTPILKSRARDLCELTLRTKNGIREGLDIKKDMDAIENIIKNCKFEASNAKNAADFESVGELMVYYGKKGWHPKWHMEPQDSVDFLMENIQNYLKRLVINEGNFSEQVEEKRERYNMMNRLDNIQNEEVELDETADIEYEDDDLLKKELGGEIDE